MARASVRESANVIAAELNDQIRREQSIPRNAKAVAEAAEAYAKSLAPVRTGAYRESIRTERRPDRNGFPVYRVLSDSPIAGYIEYGTKHNREFAVFAKTARRFNLAQAAVDESGGGRSEYWGGYWG